jgi:DNA mismatch repair protein MutS
LANSERYITDDLKRVEEEILGADAEIEQLERQLFASLIASLLPNLDAVLVLANILDDLDVSCSLAQCAVTYNYVKPHLVDEATLEIIEGRHPVVERMLPVDEPFIANDVSVSRRSDTIMIITGPNMAGKSVILRQTGLIVLLAQIGSFVPATKATIGIVDRIFTRVGASDNLAAGESTFLVEMHETARILHAATSQSLVLLDEVGRGTATYDGLAIARALVEFLHNEDRLRPRTLFATHYHELNVLEKELPFVVNYRVEAKEYRNKLVFLRKLVRGSGDHSLGIAVARMAGLPDSLIRNAKKYLQTYMSQATAGHGNQHQIPIFDQQPEALTEAVDDVDELRQRLRQVDVDDITPREALTLLYEFHRLSQDKPLH